MILAKRNGVEVLLDLAFYHQQQWSGGKSGSHKIYEVFKHAGYILEEVEEPKRSSKIKMLIWSIQGVLRFGIYKPFGITSLRNTGFVYFRYTYFIKRYPTVQHYLIEATGFGAVQAAAVLKQNAKRVYFTPCNIESLAPYPNAWTHQLQAIDRLKVELPFYIMADACFCVSLEEVWLLNILGAKAFFFPHYPPEALLEKIEARRNLRAAVDTKDGYLYFANFNNSPNFLGFQNFVAEQKYVGKKIKVAGLGIEKILPLINGVDAFEVLGTISDEELELQLIHCEKVILHHYPTSGILTRVPELLLSGIPIEGNVDALKEYLLMPDIDSSIISKHLQQLSGEANNLLIATIEGNNQ